MTNSSDPELIASDIDLIEGIYAATTQEGSLKEAARTFLSLQGDIGGAIFHFDSIAETPSGFEVFTSPPDMESVAQELFDNYSHEFGSLDNPLITAGLKDLMAGKVLISDDVMPYEEFQKTDYYKTVIHPLGIRRSMGWVVAGNAQLWLTFTSSRDELAGKYQPQHLARAQLFQRHMARAIHILELLTDSEGNRLVFEQAIERVPQAIVLVDDTLNIHFLNASAKALISSTNSLSGNSNRFLFGETAHERATFEKWWSILTTAQVGDGARFNPSRINPIWEIEVSRVSSRGAGATQGRRWMLSLKRSPDNGVLPVDYLMSRYALTRAEAKVCIALCNNGDAVSVANAMCITANTVRSHLKNIFKKTGFKSQVELAVNLIRTEQ
ncbi:hypothetical protein G8770_16795 [Aestuariicella hydrocarbonica]|uniref:HTH luxR-type domain-containing protein n=1 Tax=Pseudomaricurvus hydrocarbonicus TaxID=1470433 RepID=A0A9E5MMZ5_9GAMM|nr:LuxR C-terminal-related transcriptional regulator [Aestuariicella hydrocarbonica]NHO67208.1 hypothetical protein [Aestuariicella hydrocarbonica]